MEPKQAKQAIELAIDQLDLFTQLRKVNPESASISELADGIREIGLQQPLTARRVDGKYVLIDGERRYWACRKLGMTTVPVIVEDAVLSDADVIRRQMIPNCQREDMNPVEKARAVSRLMTCTGWTAAETASRLGMSSATAARLLALLALPPAILARVEAGEVPASAAYELGKVKDAAEQALLADKAANGELTRDEIAGQVKVAKSGQKNAKHNSARVSVPLTGNRSVTVLADALTLEGVIATLEEVLLKARRARTSGLALGTFVKMLGDQLKPSQGKAS